MKKFVTLALALVMVAALAVTAFAATATNGHNKGEGSYDVAVNATFSGGQTYDDPVYGVMIEWDAFDFEYHVQNVGGTWNPETLQYDNADGDATGWVDGKDSATITVTNHSNAVVNVKASVTDGDFTVAGDATVGAGANLTRATANTPGGATEITVNAGGTIDATGNAATVTIVIAAVAAES